MMDAAIHRVPENPTATIGNDTPTTIVKSNPTVSTVCPLLLSKTSVTWTKVYKGDNLPSTLPQIPNNTLTMRQTRVSGLLSCLSCLTCGILGCFYPRFQPSYDGNRSLEAEYSQQQNAKRRESFDHSFKGDLFDRIDKDVEATFSRVDKEVDEMLRRI